MNNKMKLKFGRLTLELDKNEVFPEDPGQGTPAMIYLYKNNRLIASGTFDCVLDTGMVEDEKLTKKEINWLDSQSDLVNEIISQWIR